jgi:hypothetical protein
MRSLLLYILLSLPSTRQSQTLILKTKAGDKILISRGLIYYNSKKAGDERDDIVYDSKYNRVIEQNKSKLLFLEIDDRPNFAFLRVFKLTDQKAKQIIDCVYNDDKQFGGPAPFTDIDHDGKLEFGGFNISEAHDNSDSMYYDPSKYYEIDNGEIRFDSALTRKMDLKRNGVFKKDPLDKNGNCCIVIKKPKH